jgi:hypothetical protein
VATCLPVSIVGIAIGFGLEDPGSIPGAATFVFFTVSSVLSNVYRGPVPRG